MGDSQNSENKGFDWCHGLGWLIVAIYLSVWYFTGEIFFDFFFMLLIILNVAFQRWGFVAFGIALLVFKMNFL